MRRLLRNSLIRMLCLTVSVIWSIVFFTVAIKIFDKLWG
jgi:hypothetical protein